MPHSADVQPLGRFVKSEKAEREGHFPQAQSGRAPARRGQRTPEPARLRADFQAVRAGLHEGELAALTWGSIQFGVGEDDPERYLVVERNYDRRWSRKMLTPKSHKPRRVDMSRALRRVLLELRKERLAQALEAGRSDIFEDLVLLSDVGTTIEMNNFCQRVFAPLLAKAGLRRIRCAIMPIFIMPTSCAGLALEALATLRFGIIRGSSLRRRGSVDVCRSIKFYYCDTAGVLHNG
jgi:hypothetical protein